MTWSIILFTLLIVIIKLGEMRANTKKHASRKGTSACQLVVPPYIWPLILRLQNRVLIGIR